MQDVKSAEALVSSGGRGKCRDEEIGESITIGAFAPACLPHPHMAHSATEGADVAGYDNYRSDENQAQLRRTATTFLGACIFLISCEAASRIGG